MWTGAISFGLVTVPVKLYSALDRKNVRFHQLAAKTGTRVVQRRIDPKTEEEVVADFRAHGIEAVLVAFDIESVTGAPPCTSADVAGLRDRHPGTFVGAWGTVDPLRGAQAIKADLDHLRESLTP